jgi:hypothetical protein
MGEFDNHWDKNLFTCCHTPFQVIFTLAKDMLSECQIIGSFMKVQIGLSKAWIFCYEKADFDQSKAQVFVLFQKCRLTCTSSRYSILITGCQVKVGF